MLIMSETGEKFAKALFGVDFNEHPEFYDLVKKMWNTWVFSQVPMGVRRKLICDFDWIAEFQNEIRAVEFNEFNRKSADLVYDENYQLNFTDGGITIRGNYPPAALKLNGVFSHYV